jgi:adenine-specific DNA-methyltransferase
MKSKKLTGSFYTPPLIADFLVDYLSRKLNGKKDIAVLEPSAGNGVFIRSIFTHNFVSQIVKNVTAVEIDKAELDKIAITESRLTKINSDFLEFQLSNKHRFNLVIGNPPYIKKNLLTGIQINHCREIHKRAALNDFNPKNIWTAFLVRCIEFTDENGILAFVLPSELLQVKFAAELRELILKVFDRVEIFTFNELLFKDCKGQDTLLLIGEKKSNEKGVYYCNIDKATDLVHRNFTLAQNVNIRESKWTHHHLETFEIELLEKIRKQIKTVNDYTKSKAGIVTAANDYFIVDANTVKEYSLQKYVKRIIQKGVFVNGSVVLSEEDFNILIDSSKPAYLIVLENNSKIRVNQRINKYLQIGIEKKIDTRYKTSLRQNWYVIPNICLPPEAFFFKRCNEYPKLVKNDANVLATDSAYLVSMDDGFRINNLIYSFYNSLTLAFAELHGRYYGGGVLELTPNEFKNLPIPYIDISENRYNSFVKDFKAKTTIKDICRKNDEAILKSIDSKLDMESIDHIFRIREKLFLRRIKTN